MPTDLTPDWVDDVAVTRFCAGEKVGRDLTRAEKLAAATKLVHRGWAVSSAAEHAGIRRPELEQHLAAGGRS